MTNQTQNHNTFAVIQRNGGLPSVVNQNDAEYFMFLQAGYEVVKSGNKKDCNEYVEDALRELVDYHEIID